MKVSKFLMISLIAGLSISETTQTAVSSAKATPPKTFTFSVDKTIVVQGLSIQYYRYAPSTQTTLESEIISLPFTAAPAGTKQPTIKFTVPASFTDSKTKAQSRTGGFEITVTEDYGTDGPQVFTYNTEFDRVKNGAKAFLSIDGSLLWNTQANAIAICPGNCFYEN
ncbi:MAG: hypothetical protein NTZ68_03985 [Candidatus Dependentiae bacterium]|nr:hypothetical protein [Candidatus Dependentiae bacterium]